MEVRLFSVFSLPKLPQQVIAQRYRECIGGNVNIATDYFPALTLATSAALTVLALLPKLLRT
jgi:hypothetical protein